MFPKFFETNGTEVLRLSPVNIVLNYAWYFERDRYDWSFEITRNLTEYNEKFLKGYAIGPEYLRTILAEPQNSLPFNEDKGNVDMVKDSYLSVTACHTEQREILR